MSADRLFVEDGHGGYRPSDPVTSQEAAIAAIGRKADHQRLVLDALHWAGDDGLTDHELAARTGLIQTSCGKRRGELRDAGLVRQLADEKGKVVKRLSPSGSPCIVWTLTASGYVQAETVTA